MYVKYILIEIFEKFLNNLLRAYVNPENVLRMIIVTYNEDKKKKRFISAGREPPRVRTYFAPSKKGGCPLSERTAVN